MRFADGTHIDLIDVADLAYESHGPDGLYAQFLPRRAAAHDREQRSIEVRVSGSDIG
ncbi:hypothetical protein [Gordonia sp. (in: high G+C Gram-positive bacteria)]|uniref:hypothetical protein n=1 Tax=Gordonia sp. (in: high G+C Gram-positive bacteria) TaxID=84139 RepID=UPI003F94A6A8